MLNLNENIDTGACFCLPDYYGDPYQGCTRECETNNDCNKNLACIKYKVLNTLILMN